MSYLGFRRPSEVAALVVEWTCRFKERSLGDLDLCGLAFDRLILKEQALHSNVSFASPPHLQTGVFVVPQHLHFYNRD